MRVVSRRIVRAFNRSRSTGTIALDDLKVSARLLYLCRVYKIKFYGSLGQVFSSIPSFLSNRLGSEIVDGKSPQEYAING